MPRFFLIGYLLLTCLGGWQPASAGETAAPFSKRILRVMTYNIRLNTPVDRENAWPYRKDRVAELIRFYQPDLLGVQEALSGMLDDLQQRLPEYAWIGVGRDDGKDAGEFSAIFYRRDRFQLVEQSTFWLSEKPELPGGKGWDAACPRVVTWGKLQDNATGGAFVYFNTHFDHMGKRAREESARLLLTRIPTTAGTLPVIVTGDFNSGASSTAYRLLTGGEEAARSGSVLRDSREAAILGHHGPEGTFAGFSADGKLGGAIDYVFVGKGIRVIRHAVLPDTPGGRHPSDHLPVLVDLLLN